MLALRHSGRNGPWHRQPNAAEWEKLQSFGAALKGVLHPSPGSGFSYLLKKRKFLASRKSELDGTQLNPSHSSFTTPQQGKLCSLQFWGMWAALDERANGVGEDSGQRWPLVVAEVESTAARHGRASLAPPCPERIPAWPPTPGHPEHPCSVASVTLPSPATNAGSKRKSGLKLRLEPSPCYPGLEQLQGSGRDFTRPQPKAMPASA